MRRPLHIAIFGLSITSSWGNGHATLWRGLCRALAARGHRLTFFERDTPYYSGHRDMPAPPGVDVQLYPDWTSVLPRARVALREADVVIVTSFCPDAIVATEAALESSVRLRVFYDLDAPVTLDALRRGQRVSYLGPRGLADFELVLSFTGGAALDELRARLGARRVAPLYGHVDPTVHRPAAGLPEYAGSLSYLGTYSSDRQRMLEELLVETARRRPERRFVIGGSLYRENFPWTQNIHFVSHVPPERHSAFFCSSPLTLNVTRGPMARMGYCPSGRLFEAAACGVPVLSDWWEGLEHFFEPEAEILVARSTDDALRAVDQSREDLARIGAAARRRTLAQHTAERRALELEALLDRAMVQQPLAREIGKRR